VYVHRKTYRAFNLHGNVLLILRDDNAGVIESTENGFIKWSRVFHLHANRELSSLRLAFIAS
jgi:hypothetical protein